MVGGGVLSSLVMGEKKPRTPGNDGCVSKDIKSGGLRLLWRKREHNGSRRKEKGF